MHATAHSPTVCPLKLRLNFVPAYGLNFWSGLYDILVGVRPMSSKNGHHGWFLGWQFFTVKIDINRNWISATTQPARLSV